MRRFTTMNTPATPSAAVAAMRSTIDEARAARAVFKWNTEHEIGTPVLVLDEAGLTHQTTTRGNAYLFRGRASILLDGAEGAFSLDQISLDPAPELPPLDFPRAS